MRRAGKIALTILFSIGAILLLMTTIYRWNWQYNEMGVHFEEESMTTYEKGAIGVYGLLTILIFVPAFLLWRGLVKPKNS